MLGRLDPDLPVPSVVLNRPIAIVRGWFGGMIGWAEAYMAGDWQCHRLQRLTDWAMANERALERAFGGSSLAAAINRLVHRMRPNSLRGSRRNIASHYDLGNEFYRRWLDPSMSYSSALFEGPDTGTDSTATLEVAQQHKNRTVLQWLEAQPGERVLEIGCGWGGFAEALFDADQGLQTMEQSGVEGVKNEGRMKAGWMKAGSRYHGVTLSREQLLWCQQRLQDYNSKALFELRDYRQLDQQYARIVSIEMLEAVGEANWPHYFGLLKQRLAPKGCAVIQVITIADERFDSYRSGADFIQRYIFPGGMLPSPKQFQQQVDAAGLKIDRELSFGTDYARTLAVWAENFEQAWPQLRKQGFDSRFYRMWRYYLAYCQSGFKAGSIDVKLYRLRHSD